MSEFCTHNTHESHYCGSCIQESFDLRIKNATAEELMQNEAVKELVDALEFVACRLDYRPTNKANCEAAAIFALKKFEAKDV